MRGAKKRVCVDMAQEKIKGIRQARWHQTSQEGGKGAIHAKVGQTRKQGERGLLAPSVLLCIIGPPLSSVMYGYFGPSLSSMTMWTCRVATREVWAVSKSPSLPPPVSVWLCICACLSLCIFVCVCVAPVCAYAST
jgi:hypothetical protein